MADEMRFEGRVAIVTGAGGGLGRSHALFFGSRGAKVVVNDLGGAAHGGGRSTAAADQVVETIRAAGGEAIANYESVEDGGRIVQAALDTWGRVDILVNNAGILRDTSFHKMSEEDWALIDQVHLLGAFRVTQAAWVPMRDAGYGRIVMTASAAGIYGNFGQANYATAKLGLVGLANTLAVEGRKKGVQVNTIAPIAGSRLTETVLPKELTDALRPEYVTPLVGWLCHEACAESGGLFEVGGGFFAKLRFERAKGKMVRLGRPISAEVIRGAWHEITSFDASTHPTDITASMAPILANVQAGPSRGGNELIDVDAALGYEFPEQTSSYDARDVALYAISVGAAQDPLDATELQLVYERHGDGFRVLPTFGVIPALNLMVKLAAQGKQAPGLNYGFDRVLHGAQRTEVKRLLPPRARLRHKMRVRDIWDKGKGAVVVSETRTFDADTGEELVINETTTFVRGAGGWGGERGPAQEGDAPPGREPDAVVTERIADNQALLYRLLGDWNPLHVDPQFAKGFGFDRPILHGLCTYGYAARHVARAMANNDPRWVRSIQARFTESVFPGETLVTEMWKDGALRVVFRCKVKERDKVVLANAAIELFEALPVAPAHGAAAPQATGASKSASVGSSAELTSRGVFAAIRHHIETHPELAARVATSFVFKLTSPDSAWSLDMKAGKGVVTEGALAGSDVVLELSDADFVAMSTGKADAQKLYFGGKLKIIGNVMAAQKLDFLKGIDAKDIAARQAGSTGLQPAEVPAANAAAKGAGGVRGAAGVTAATPVTAATGVEDPAGTDPSAAARVFAAIADYMARTPELVGKVQAVFVIKLTSPDSAWTLDLKSGAGTVAAGATQGAETTLELSASDFMEMISGKADPQQLYFAGKLKITGNVMASQKLSFLKKVGPLRPPSGVAPGEPPLPGAVARAAPSGGASSAPRSPALLDALAARLAHQPVLASEVDALVQLVVTEPDATYALDLRRGRPPSIARGAALGATTTLTLAEETLFALASGDVAPQALFQQGKLRVDGDMRVAHHLGFIKGVRA